MSRPDDNLPPGAGPPQGPRSPSGPTLFFSKRDDHPIPAKTATIAMWIFLAALAMLFAAGMLAYIMMRFDLMRFGVEEQPTAAFPARPPVQPVHLSPIFLASTLVVLLASVTIQWAVATVRLQDLRAAKFWIWASLGLAVLFCALQVPGLTDLWGQHVARHVPGANMAKFIAVLIVLHALHVVGGVVYLVIVAVRAGRGVYDHEHYTGIRHAALYWHFLDLVWLAMYGTMFFAG